MLKELLNCTEAHRTEFSGILVQPPLAGWKAELFGPPVGLIFPQGDSPSVLHRNPPPGAASWASHNARGLDTLGRGSPCPTRQDRSGVGALRCDNTLQAAEKSKGGLGTAPQLQVSRSCQEGCEQAPSSCVSEALQQSAVFPAVLPNSFHLQTRDVH